MTNLVNNYMLMIMITIFSLLCIVLAISLGVARKVYAATPANELKRRAVKKETNASKLFQAVTYGDSLWALLWGGIAILGSVGIVLLARSANILLSVAVIISTLSFLFIWLPVSRVTSLGMRVTLFINPVVVWLLAHLHPILSRGAEIAEKRYPAAHTGLFERNDIVQLITQQADQQDSRLSIEELAIVQRALTFGDYQVGDILTPRSTITTVSVTETLGPILIDELHKSTAPFVLVLEGKSKIVGSLEVNKLGLQSSGPISEHLSPVYFLHQKDTLREALHAFFVTNYPLFVVVNSFEEYVGIVTIESVLRQLLGHIPGDDFEQYSDLVAVAARHPQLVTAKSTSNSVK